MLPLLLPLALGFSPGLVPRTNGGEQRAAVAMAAKRIALGIVGPGLVGGEVMAQIEATTALLEKQGLDVVMAAVSELKPDADGKLQGWQICSDTNLKIADFKAALADPAAGEVFPPGIEPQRNRLEPRTNRCVTHACEPRLGQAVVHLLWIIGDGALFFFLLMNWQVCNPTQRGLQPCAARPATLCGPACNPMRCGLQPYAAGSIALLMNRRQAMCTPVDGMCEPRNWWYNLSIQVRDGLFA